jgi:site-specific recombinase XerD
MSPKKSAITPTEIYDQALKYSRDLHLPPGIPRPSYTATWLPENVAALERYREWLSGGGISSLVIRTYHIPMAGHALSINHKPTAEIDVNHDLQLALDYIYAKGLSAQWNDNCRLSLVQFRRFLLSERGLSEPRVPSHASAPNTVGLPAWVVEELTHYQRLQQRNWRTARLETNILRFWCGHLHVWRFLVEVCGVNELADVRRKHLYDYAEQRLSLGKSVSTINTDLRNFHSFMRFLQEEDYTVPQALLRLHGLKQPESLPKYLTDEQVRALRDEFEGRIVTAVGPHRQRDAMLDRAIFYLFWQSGLRLGEVEELRLEDLDLTARKLSVRNGKGMKDRTVYLTNTTVYALTAYLAVRGPGASDHVFLYRHQALCKDLVHSRIRDAGKRAGVKVYPHRLRHTCATQLLNAGCPVTSIQKFLGHKQLNTTMVYARAHDQTVEADYFSAMRRIEQRLELVNHPVNVTQTMCTPERDQLLSLAEQLFAPEMSFETRLEIASQMRGLLVDPSEWIPPPVISTVETI